MCLYAERNTGRADLDADHFLRFAPYIRLELVEEQETGYREFRMEG